MPDGKTSPHRGGLSLTELLAAVAILGVLAAMALPRTEASHTAGRRAACHVNRSEIELQSALWFREHGAFPATNLSDLGADPTYFPQGAPTCPLDGTTYTIDTNGRIVGHDH